MTKQELRQLYRSKRIALTHKELNTFDDLILIQFQRILLEDFSSVLSYQPIAHFNEPGTYLLTSYLKYLEPDVQIAFPKSDFTNNTMDAVIEKEDTIFNTNNWGIVEPVGVDILSPEEIDIILIPLLAFDVNGARVGYGKGFYDRYLQRCRPSVLKIGVSYFEAVAKIDDVEPIDIPLQYCVTPNKVYAF